MSKHVKNNVARASSQRAASISDTRHVAMKAAAVAACVPLLSTIASTAAAPVLLPIGLGVLAAAGVSHLLGKRDDKS